MRRFLVAAAALASAPAAAADLAWMSGCWQQTQDDRWTEECWTVPRAGQLMGSGRAGDASGVRSFEFMRIAPGEDGVPVFWGAPGGSPTVPFRQVGTGAREVVFENPAHDFPTRVRYWRDGETLNAEISGREGTKPMSWRFVRM